MRIISDVTSFDEVLTNLVLTIGSFDGVHRGHQHIIQTLRDAAAACSGVAALMTLRPHPRQFFSPRHAPNILTSPKLKERLLSELGLDALFILPFNAEIANLDRQAFFEQIVIGRCRARTIVVGHDFAFGKGALGNTEFLCDVAPGFGIEIIEVPPLIIRGERVSSTLIRERIIQGDLQEAEAFLGRKYTILGQVVRGRGIGGSKLGYPTANIKPENNAVPAHGVYVAEVLLDGKPYRSAVNIGIAPTIRQEDVTIEAFILDFDGDIVGSDIEIIFHKRLRPEKRFDSYDALIHAIARDVQDVRDYFNGRA